MSGRNLSIAGRKAGPQPSTGTDTDPKPLLVLGRPQFPASFEKTKQPANDWLTANEAANYLKVKPRTLLLWARQGKVKGYTLSGATRHVWRFRHADLDATLEMPSVRPEERMVR